ncbi:DUF1501 domain-containing protein [Thalassoroseus pseudoceratinae]|uniref:DUF1501 domain-containing protein n=1 Tax=Thalassoroseus pseudoceratinae TaxID=2713176 RepID=UPI00141FA5BF|nr:DUF1501 domain-containing protein [Thalassoroseus pseudoceratinae]
MLRVDAGRTESYCDGMNRRSFLQVGMAGLGALSLPNLLRAKEASRNPKDTSLILLWLDGGPSHMDMYDMKPEAPVEYRGIWNPIRTNVSGFDMTELFPKQAHVADKFSVVRSLHHNNGDHFAGGHWMLTGRGGASGADKVGKYPFFGSIVSKMRGAKQPGVPANVAIPYAMSIGIRPGYFGGNYLGVQHDPFQTQRDPSRPNFQVPNLNMPSGISVDRLGDRRHLLAQFDGLRRETDRSGMMDAMDRFEQNAFEMVTGPAARQAFDIESEDPRLRDKYGRNTWGQSTLLARRLVEAGSTVVSCHFGGWDHHWNLQSGYERVLPKIDALVSALFDDLSTRGLLDSTLVMLCGEFSRTPRMNDGSGNGTPGRDHWGNSMFCLMGGGGIQGGRLIGSTDRLGAAPQDNPKRPGDIHHTVFKAMGVDPNLSFLNHAGRPIAAIDHGSVIEELF